jgi:SepF-like predicted cell division protein (DUF552 family)
MVFKKIVMRQSSGDKEEEIKVVNQAPGVKFYSLLDVVRAERIVTEVEEGNLVFLNIGRITAFPERKKEFLQNLKDCSAQLHVTLKMVSEEIIMVAPSSVPIEIRSLSPVKIEEESEDTLDELENN